MTTQVFRKVFAAVLFVAVVANVSAQQTKKEKPGVKKANIGVTVNAHDYDTKTIFPKEDSAYGFSVLFWKGITPKVDYSIRYNGIFPNENKNSVISKNGISNELELAFHAKAFPDKAVFNPFLTLGVGGGSYHKDLAPVVVDANKNTLWTGHALGGVGFQINIKSELYFLAQAHYRYSFNESKLPHNLFYGVGLTRSLTKPKPKPVEVKVADRDNDGVADNIDACPDVPGVASLQGCPDKDGDGIADKDDACPDVKGLVSLKGCPDRDGDGIADNSDKCPDVKGLAKYEGCPIPDTDKDGINDEQDKCPTVAGVARYEGCPVPDGDNDGVNDEEDKCPTVAGVAENQGCPVIPEEVKKKVTTAATKILFVTGSAKLQSSSFKGLNEVAKVMNENPDMLLSVDGHTDNVGTDEKNIVLSQNRADAVKAYLVKKGISEERIAATGHGETTPVADNKTAKGRQQNRRSELTLSYFK